MLLDGVIINVFSGEIRPTRPNCGRCIFHGAVIIKSPRFGGIVFHFIDDQSVWLTPDRLKKTPRLSVEAFLTLASGLPEAEYRRLEFILQAIANRRPGLRLVPIYCKGWG